jgi:hypothetical protein
MRTRLLLPTLPLLLVAACGGGLGSHKGVAQAKIDVVDDMLEILEGVNDKASAQKAKPKIEALEKRMDEINAAEAKLGEPTPEEAQELMGTVMKDMMSRMERMMKVQEKLMANPEIQEVLGDLNLSK